uniref:Uncharacterized protein n=1 Tax=Elaeophora elaphi TaxID=1147741 RepID=A0A158Q7A0_9BILA
MERESQRRRDENNQLKLDTFRKKQLDLQMLVAMRNSRINIKDPIHPQELTANSSSENSRATVLVNAQISSMPYVESSKPGQYPGSLSSRPYGKMISSTQSLLSPVASTAENKIAKEIENLQFLPTSTARTPSQKRKKDEKASTEKHSQKINEVKVQQHEPDISVLSNNRLDKRKRKKSTKKRKSRRKPEARYQHQVQSDNVHEWISRIACAASPLPYFSPNKRILLVPEPSTENMDDKNDEENKNSDSWNTTGTNTTEKSTSPPSYSKAGEQETDVEISTEMKERSTPMTSSFSSPISSSINALPTEKPKEKVLWNPPDRRAEARLNRTLENSW